MRSGAGGPSSAMPALANEPDVLSMSMCPRSSPALSKISTASTLAVRLCVTALFGERCTRSGACS